MEAGRTTGYEAFPDTSWSLIHQCRDPEAPEYRERLDRLFAKYWKPIYSYLLVVCKHNLHEAKDLTQDFLLRMFEKNALQHVSGEKGSFRSYLRAALCNFTRNARRDGRARKRSPVGRLVSLDQLANAHPGLELAVDHRTPEEVFDAKWKRTLLARAMKTVRTLAADTGKGALVELYIRYEEERGRVRYKDLARESDLTEHQIRNGFHWVRKRFAEALRAEVRDIVANAADLDREMRALFGAS